MTLRALQVTSCILLFSFLACITFAADGVSHIKRLPEPLAPQSGAGIYHDELKAVAKAFGDIKKLSPRKWTPQEIRAIKHEYPNMVPQQALEAKVITNFYYLANALLTRVEKDYALIARRVISGELPVEAFLNCEIDTTKYWLVYYFSCAPLIRPGWATVIRDGVFIDNYLLFTPTTYDIGLKLWGVNYRMSAKAMRINAIAYKKSYLQYLAELFGEFSSFTRQATLKIIEIEKNLDAVLNAPILSGEDLDVRMATARLFRSKATFLQRTLRQIEVDIKSAEEIFVKGVVEAYPKDGNSVRALLKTAGYSNMETAILLQRNFGRSKDNRYLFTGLPSEKEVNKAIEEQKKKAEQIKGKGRTP